MRTKVHLKPALPEHAGQLVKAMEGSNLNNFAFFTQPVTEEKEREYIERVIREGNHLFLVINQEDRIVGTVGLHEVDNFSHTARVGLTIFCKSDQRHGYGRKAMYQIIDLAFETLGIEKLYANVIASNHKQIKWDQGFGFHVEGYLSSEYLLLGKRHDMVRLALLKSDLVHRAELDR